MRDWRTMMPGVVFDQYLAELSGWTDIEVAHGWFEHPEYGSDYQSYLRGTTPNGMKDIPVPKFSSNVDDALSLVTPECAIKLSRGAKGIWYCGIETHHHQLWLETTVIETTPAMAICLAWVVWKEAPTNPPHDADEAEMLGL